LSLASVIVYGALKRDYEFFRAVSELEQAVRLAKVLAMERGKEVSVCLKGNALELRELSCSGRLVKRLAFTHRLRLTGRAFRFDARGLSLEDGSVCLTDGKRFYRVEVRKWGSPRVRKGRGGCG